MGMRILMVGRTGSLFVAILALHSYTLNAEGISPFKIRVVDNRTGRGVPLVELRTVNEIRYYTDSNGIAAFHEPGLMDTEVFFFVSSHGYSYPKDGFGMAGVRLQTQSGGESTVQIHRNNRAERLYRITGQGIYRDSLLVGEPVPLQQPALNGRVSGQDSTLAVPYRGKIYWFWGDTSRPEYPLGNFRVSGATSDLPSEGGLPPERGIDLHYFVDAKGFCKSLCPFKESGLIWIDGVLTVKDSSNREILIASYSHRKSLEEMLEHGLVVFNDERQEFEKVVEFDFEKKWQCPRSHPFRVREEGREYFYFPTPFPNTRVVADFASLQDQSRYEAFSCLKPGTRYRGKDSQLERLDGKLVYSWKTGTDPIGPSEEKELIERGILSLEEARFMPRDTDSGKPVVLHSGSVQWNPYLRGWLLIAVEIGGSSFLGEVWCALSDTLTGPWKKAVKIVTHDRYTFYNPVHHPFFDQQNHRAIYFEGTYATTFSDAPFATPGYDYNQILYRLDLSTLDELER